MRTIIGNFGEARICNNMDDDFGLPSLPEKSWDLCLTDPKYNIDYKKPSGLGEKPKKNWEEETELYDDLLPPEVYQKECKTWMDQLLQVCDQIVFTPGNPNLKWWQTNYDIYDILVWYKRNSQAGGKGAYLLRHEWILVMNPMKKGVRFSESVFDVYLQSGFLRKNFYKHPAPKEIKLWERIIDEYKPRSVLDIHLGSGTTAEVCEQRGIPWLGYDLKYADTIQERVEKGMEKHKYYKPPKKKLNQSTLV